MNLTVQDGGGSRWLVGFIPTWTTCSRHNTSRFDRTQHTTCPRSISVGGTFWLLVPCMSKLHTRSAKTWTTVSTFIRSHQQALGNHTNELTPVGFEPSISVVKLFHFLLELRVHGLACVPSVYHEGLGGSRWLLGFIPTWTTCSHHKYQSIDWSQHTTRKLQAALSWKKLKAVPGTMHEKRVMAGLV